MRKIVAVVLWAGVPFCGQPLRGQAPSEGVQAAHNQKQKAALRAADPGNPQIGTEARPAFVELKDRPKGKDEAAEDRRKNDTKEYRDAGTFYAAVASAIIGGLLLIVGALGVKAALSTLDAISRQADLQERAIRPWVGTVSVGKGALVEDRLISADIVLKNTGPSVALRGLMIPFLVRGSKLKEGKNNSWAGIERTSVENGLENGFVLHPGATHTHSVYLPLGDIQDFELEDGVCYVLVCIMYMDQFDRIVHRTQDCFRVMLPARPLVTFQAVPAHQTAN